MPWGHVGILAWNATAAYVCVCVFVCVYARTHHRWQHLRLNVWLSSVATEAHQAVLTCNSDELCKSSMKLNLRLGPQHTHTHTHTILSDGCPDNTWPWVYVCVCACVCVYAPNSNTFIKWLCSVRQYFCMVRCILGMIHICFYRGFMIQFNDKLDITEICFCMYWQCVCVCVCVHVCVQLHAIRLRISACYIYILPRPALLNNRTFPTITIILMATVLHHNHGHIHNNC